MSHAYSAPVRVTVAGALPRTDIGFHPVAEDTVEGHDTATKGAVTDGMKRAFRTFGVQFGNGFYGDQQQTVNAPKPERAPVRAPVNDRSAKAQPKDRNDSQAETLRKRLMELAGEQGFDEGQVRAAVKRQTGKDLEDLTVDEIRPLVEAAANKLRERQAQAA